MPTPQQPTSFIQSIQDDLTHAHDDNPVWRAVNRILEHQIESVSAAIETPELTAQREFASGGFAHLRGLQRLLLHHRRLAMERSGT